MPADASVPAEKLPVPHAVMWSGEITTQRGLTVRPDGSGLCYQDETRADRDKHGVLWARVHQAPGEGRPNYRALHSVRQRRAMHGMLCQVCGGPASRTSRGWLFLIQRSDAPQDGVGLARGLAVHQTPHLRTVRRTRPPLLPAPHGPDRRSLPQAHSVGRVRRLLPPQRRQAGLSPLRRPHALRPPPRGPVVSRRAPGPRTHPLHPRGAAPSLLRALIRAVKNGEADHLLSA